MKKVITLFERDWDGDRSRVLEVLNPDAAWVADGEGIATRKWDGTCCMIRDGEFFKRYDAKHGKTPPEGFEPAQDPDPETGHWPGWLPVSETDANDRWFREGLSNTIKQTADQMQVPSDLIHLRNTTYELVGPKVNSNREQLQVHLLIPHGELMYLDAPRTYSELEQWFKENDIEGLVWHRDHGNPDTDMVKIKASDFGLTGWKNRRS